MKAGATAGTAAGRNNPRKLTSMQHCNVLIVGAGPAGSSLAWSLRGSGLSVILLDKTAFPRDKVCAGWVTPEVIDTLRIETEDYRRGRVLQPITGFRIGLLGRPPLEIHYPGAPVSYGIRRFEFDHFLLQRAGVPLPAGIGFKGMERDGAGWAVVDSGIFTATRIWIIFWISIALPFRVSRSQNSFRHRLHVARPISRQLPVRAHSQLKSSFRE